MMAPIRPSTVLAVAVVLPGVGQVLNNQPRRGLVFVFYMLLLGVLTQAVADPDRSLVGTFAGGIFVYALSIMDAYRGASVRRRASEVRPDTSGSP